MNNSIRTKKVLELIQEIFGNTDIEPQETRKDLQYIVDEIEILIDTLPKT